MVLVNNCEHMDNININKQASERNPVTKVYKIFDVLKDYI